MATVKHIRDYKVKSGDEFFFDNCVWMHIFSSISGSNQRKQDAYSALLRDIQTTGACIWINSLVASEYINASQQIGFRLWKIANGIDNANYKRDYRPLPEFLEVQKAAYDEMNDILALSLRRPDDFNAIQPGQLFKAKGMDFNDAYYASLCNLNKYILVTDDKDLLLSPLDITILTI